MTDADHQSRVEAVVWSSRRKTEGGGKSGARGKWRCLVEFSVALSAGLAFLFVFHKPVLGAVVLCIGGTILLSGLFLPPLYRGIQKLVKLTGKGVGMVLTWVLLVPFFYICFTAGRLILVLTGKDPLCRRCPTNEQTYWTPRKPLVSPDHYKRQY